MLITRHRSLIIARDACLRTFRAFEYRQLLAPLHSSLGFCPYNVLLQSQSRGLLDCTGIDPATRDISSYRDGKCHQCDCCPLCWSCVELHSEHYDCAARNGLKAKSHYVQLDALPVGAVIDSVPKTPGRGFLQCPTLQRLPPGLEFFDDGSLRGKVQYDPLRPETYDVEFVAMSLSRWNDDDVGLVRLHINFSVEENIPRQEKDFHILSKVQREHGLASAHAMRATQDAFGIYELWEKQKLTMQDTVEQMKVHMRTLREILELHPKLDGGKWWVFLGGLHMNIHKLMENCLFECELYLGHALMFPDVDVRRAAEMNLYGCYRKRELEAAKFMWITGLEQMMAGKWYCARETLELAAAKKDGWGWGVNFGEIWIAAAAAKVLEAVRWRTLLRGDCSQQDFSDVDSLRSLEEALGLLDLARARRNDHPWMIYNTRQLTKLIALLKSNADLVSWRRDFERETIAWCAAVLKKVQPKARLEATNLHYRLPPHTLL